VTAPAVLFRTPERYFAELRNRKDLMEENHAFD
jgi:hypothetical protein